MCKVWIRTIVLSKPWIRAWNGHSVDCPNAHPHIIRWVHMYTDWTMVHREAFHSGWKTLLSTKKVRSKVPRRNQAEEMKSFLSGAIPVTDALSTLCVYCNTLLIIEVGTTFNGHVSALLFLVHFERIGFNPHFAHSLGYNMRIEHPGHPRIGC